MTSKRQFSRDMSDMLVFRGALFVYFGHVFAWKVDVSTVGWVFLLCNNRSQTTAHWSTSSSQIWIKHVTYKAVILRHCQCKQTQLANFTYIYRNQSFFGAKNFGNATPCSSKIWPRGRRACWVRTDTPWRTRRMTREAKDAGTTPLTFLGSTPGTAKPIASTYDIFLYT